MCKKETGFLLVIFLLAILLGGCQSAEKKPLENQPNDTGLTASDRRVLADRLSRLAMTVEGVQKATVVISDITLANDSGINTTSTENTGTTDTNQSQSSISGMIVMLGININDQMDEEKTKTDVKDKLKVSDTRISQVLVTSDPELVKKINDVAAGIIKGEPISKYQMDLKQLGKEFQGDNPAY